MMPRRVIHPGIGVDDFRLGMTRSELWALTRSHVTAFLRGESPERIDDFVAHGIHAEYDNGVANALAVFARIPPRGLAPIILLETDVAAFTRDEIALLLELHELPRRDEYEYIVVPGLGLTIWFREPSGEDAVVEFVLVEPITPS